ncbi:MAG: guanitoxin biosynthesis heme-dependent pre-guanitoxin N-hydroxylase GntA [Aquabacterium sp.]
MGMTEGGLAHLLDAGKTCSELEVFTHHRISTHILAHGFPCVVARSVLNRRTYRMGIYDTLGSKDAALGLCHDLYEFSNEFKDTSQTRASSAQDKISFTSFIATFQHPHIESELAFEELLWRQLQTMHCIDARHFDWDGTVSKNPGSPDFSFSLGGRAFFVVGLHPRSSRLARRTEMPCLVFNPHKQFETLRITGKYDGICNAIRQRDIALQGSTNPMLSHFGEQAESRQYAGRAVPSNWQCPFNAQSGQNDARHPETQPS